MNFIVFVASFCLMLIQIVSGRALAPFVGTSVYAWTGVIGTTLAALIFGSSAGGYLADRVGNRKTLGTALALAGLCGLSINFLIIYSAKWMGIGAVPLMIRVIIMSLSAFFPTAFFLAMVTPLAAKLTVTGTPKSGSAVGRLAAISAMGNVAGVLSGGYILIALVGTSTILTTVALTLLILGGFVARESQIWKSTLTGLAVIFLIGSYFLPRICDKETSYYCIRIIDSKNRDAQPVKVLRLDHLVHSYVNPADPLDLGYDYERVYADLMHERYVATSTFTTFFIGGGGYVFPRYVQAAYPASKNIVSEIDPGVTKINQEQLGLSTTTSIVTVNEDARQHLLRGGDAPYDLVFGDAFNDFSVPTHLTTVEFHRLLKSRMNTNGIYALNVIDDARYGRFLASMIRTLSAVWKYVEVDTMADHINSGRNTIILLASDEPISTSTLELISHEEVTTFLQDHLTPVLTDDFAPTDRYLAPVFKDSY
ncbi:MAG: fused MFS/spermidine synthase [Candidatus Uhrbacteria bacterium]